jgi:hypothetical protein
MNQQLNSAWAFWSMTRRPKDLSTFIYESVIMTEAFGEETYDVFAN